MNGADVAQLRALADQLARGADELDAAAKVLHSLVNDGTRWRGADAQRFRSEWSGASAHALSGASRALRDAGVVLRRNADEQQQASGATATAAELFTRIENDNRNDQGESLCDADGVRIERVLSGDGETRLIVYLKGQDSVPDRHFGRSAALSLGILGVDESITRQIDAALAGSPNGRATEIMLVGYSQGGMDAQNISAAGEYNVTNLVTYGSPIVQPDDPNVDTVHLRADSDPVPAASAFRKVAEGEYIPAIGIGAFIADLVNPPSSNATTQDSGGRRVFDAHINGFDAAARAFDASDDPRFTGVKKSMKNFEGTVTVVTE